MGFLFLCFVLMWDFFFNFFVLCFCEGFFWFSITWNVRKLFNLNVGEKQVRHYFCTTLAFLIVQMNLVPPKMVRGHTLPRILIFFLWLHTSPLHLLHPELSLGPEDNCRERPPSSVLSKRFFAHVQKI